MTALRLRPGRWAVLCVALAACTPSPPAAKTEPAKAAEAGPEVKPDAPALPAAEALLADAVTAMGGADKFAALTSYYVESQLSMGNLGLTGVAKTWWRGGADEAFLNETEMPGVGLMRIGGTAKGVWGDDPISGMRALSGKEAEQARWSATLCVAYEWKKHFKSAATVAVKDEGGKRVAEVVLTSPLDDKVTLRIDMATKLPISQSFTQVSPLGNMPATVSFEDFRDVSGLKIPYRQIADASLTKLVSTTTRVELGAPVDKVAFEMPGVKEAVDPKAVPEPPLDPVKPEAKKKG